MSDKEHKEMIEQIERALAIAERELIERKVRDGENVIVASPDGSIHSVPASRFL